MDTTLLIATSSENGDFQYPCSTTCSGIEGAHGECCNTKNKDLIVGPVPDAHEVIERLQARFPGITYEDAFMDFEEGRNLFPEKSHAQKEENYPAYRLNSDERCVFYKDKGCSIQQEKSFVCKQYVCEYLRKLSPLQIPRPVPEGIAIVEPHLQGVKEIKSYD